CDRAWLCIKGQFVWNGRISFSLDLEDLVPWPPVKMGNLIDLVSRRIAVDLRELFNESTLPEREACRIEGFFRKEPQYKLIFVRKQCKLVLLRGVLLWRSEFFD